MNNNKRCPITYELIDSNQDYSKNGIAKLSKRLSYLEKLPFTTEQIIQESYNRADKLSIQGVQAKLSAKLNIKNNGFEIVNRSGDYILKPQSIHYLEAPENEALTMSMAELIDIDVPIHGLIYNLDDRLTYFIKRFDRFPKNKKAATEDFAQVTGRNRTTKYNFSMEKLVDAIEKYCSFPAVDKVKLFKRTIFNFLTGNEDMHLKNFSVIRKNDIIQLSPAYDLINSTIILSNSKEQIALSLNGRKNNLRRKDLIKYFAYERLRLEDSMIKKELNTIESSYAKMQELIKISFLNDTNKEKYLSLLAQRFTLIFDV